MGIRRLQFHIFAFLLIALASAHAFALTGITYQGRILKPNGQPLEGTTVQFRLQIRSPISTDCLMYEEVQTIDMSGSKGLFSITLHDGNGARTDLPAPYTIEEIFANRGTFTFPAGRCNSGTTYATNPSDNRVFQVKFQDETMGTEELMPPQAINFVPFAIEAKQIAGFGSQNLLRFAEASGALVNTSPLNNAQYTELLALLGGTSSQFEKAGELNGISIPALADGQVLSWDATAGNWSAIDPVTGVQTFAKTALPVCAASEFLKDNGSGLLVCAAVAGASGGTVTQVNTGTGLTGGGFTTTGTISIAPGGVGTTELANDAVTTGKILDGTITGADLATNIAISTSGAITTTANVGAADVNASGNVTATGNVTGANVIATNVSSTIAATRELQLVDPDDPAVTAKRVKMVAPLAIAADYTLTWPLDDGTPNQVLTSNGAGVLSWTTPTTGTGDFLRDGSLAMTGNFRTGGNWISNDGGNEGIAIDTAGNVGIGLNNPSYSLEVASANPLAVGTFKDGVTITDTTANATTLPGAGTGLRFRAQTNFGSTTIGGIWAETTGVSTNGNLFFMTRNGGSTSPHMTLTNTGNFGVGTTAPVAKLEVSGAHVPGGVGLLKAKGISTHGYISVDTDTPATQETGFIWDKGGVAKWYGYVPANSSDLVFNSGGSNDRVTITAGGNVGIGTTTPNRLLEVAGPVRIAASALPGSAAAGDIAIDSGAANALKWYNGTAWLTVANTSTGGGDFFKDGSVAMTGTLKAADGAAGSVALGFANAATTGINRYNSGIETLSFVISGTERMNLQPGGLTLPNDSLTLAGGNPINLGSTGIYKIGTDSGLSRTAAGVIAVGNATQGDFSGTLVTDKIGIGTATPGVRLQLAGSGSANGMQIGTSSIYDATSNAIAIDTPGGGIRLFDRVFLGSTYHGGTPTIFTNTDTDVSMGPNGTALFTLRTDTGNVGIGTTSPNRLLEVAGPVRIAATALPGTAATGDIAIDSGAANALKWYNGSTWLTVANTTTGGGDFMKNGSVAMTGNFRSGGNWISGDGGNEGIGIDTSGNVGIGTLAPSASLEVTGGSVKFPGAGVLFDNSAVYGSALNMGWPGAPAWGALASVNVGYNGVMGFGSNGGAALDTGISRLAAGSVGIGNGTAGTSAGTLVAGKVGIGATSPGYPLEVSMNVDNNYVARFYNSRDDGSQDHGILVQTQNGGSDVYIIRAQVAQSGGLDRFTVTANGDAVISNTLTVPKAIIGTNANAAIDLVVGDSDTGLNQIADGVLSIQTNGNPRMRFDTLGNVGIGTTSPNRLLEVAGPVRISPTALPGSAAAGDIAIDSGSSNSLRWYDGSAWLTVANTSTGGGDFKKDGSVAMTGNFRTGGNWISGDGGSEGITVDNSGNVGVGTASPTGMFHVNGITTLGNGTGSNYVDIISRGDYDGLRLYSLNNASGGSVNPPSIGFYRSIGAPAVGAAQRFKILGSANGTDFDGFTFSSPNSSVVWMTGDVNSGMSFSSGTASDTPNVISISQRPYVTAGTLVVGNDTNASTPAAGGIIRSGQKNSAVSDVAGSNLTFQAGRGTGSSATGGSLLFQTPDVLVSGTGLQPYTTKMQISRSGNVGIGTTSPNRLLEVAGPIRVSPAALPGSAAAGDLAFDSGAANALKFYNGTSWQTVGTATGDFKADGSVNMTGALKHAVGTAALPGATFAGFTGTGMFETGTDILGLSTAGAERMRIDAAGSVGIGTTTPATMLSVNGSAQLGNGGESCNVASQQGAIRYNSVSVRFEVCRDSTVGWEPIVQPTSSAAVCDTTATYNTAGTWGYTVPASFSTITITVWGGGGGGGGTGDGGATAGGNGGTSSISSLSLSTGGGGGGGPGGIGFNGAAGSAGIATGGSTNTTGAAGGAAGGSRNGGSAPNGGSGGAGTLNTVAGPGSSPGAGGGGAKTSASWHEGVGGGSGGYLTKTYSTATLLPGTNISDIVVGSGGTAGAAGTAGYAGGAGAPGRVSITCSTTPGVPAPNDRGIVFHNSGNFGSSTTFVYDASGNVGIGTATPNRKLEVAGPIRISPSALPGSAAAGDIAIDSGSANGLKYYNGTSWQAIGIGNGDFLAAGTVPMTGNIRLNGNYLSGDGGSEGVAVDASGNVGIGTTAPTHALTFPTASTGVSYYNTADQTTNYERTTMQWGGNAFYIDTSLGGTGTQRSLWLSRAGGGNNGYMGLHANGQIMLYAATGQTVNFGGNGGALWSMNSGTGDWYSTYASGPLLHASNASATNPGFVPNKTDTTTGIGAGASGAISFITAGTEKLRMDNAGNVGIGTTSPSGLLEVSSSTGTNLARFTATSGDASISMQATALNSAGIGFRRNGAGGTRWRIAMDSGAEAGSNAGSDFKFDSYDDSGVNLSTPFVIKRATGNVGIGTQNPGRLLHVAGPMRLTPAALPGTGVAGDIAIDSGAANALKYYDGSAWIALTGGGAGDFKADGSVSMTAGLKGFVGTSALPGYTFTGMTGTGMFETGTDILGFSTAGSERMRVLANGNVGIGTTSPNSTLQVGGSLATTIGAQAASYTLTAADNVLTVDASGGARTITLPTAVGINGRQYTIKKTDSSLNAVTLATTSAQTIDGAATVLLSSQYKFVQVISDGANWGVIGTNATPSDFGMFLPGPPTANLLLRALAARPAVLPASLAGSYCIAKTGATASTVININRIRAGASTAIGTATFAAGGGANQTCTFSAASAVSIQAGDMIEYIFPASVDVTLADIAITLTGN